MTSRRPIQITYSGEIDDRFLEVLYQMPRRLILNSEGGCVYTMSAALDLLDGLGDVEIVGTGCIFSAAVAILANGARRFCTKRTRFMVHESEVDNTEGRAGDLAKDVTEMARANRMYAEVLVARTKKSRAFWTRLMRKTTYFGATQALEWGLVDAIL